MADLSDLNSAQMTKLTGSDSSGVEQTPVQSTAQGGLHVNLRDNSGAEITTFGISAGTNIIGAIQNSTTASAVALSANGDFFLQTGALKYSGIIFEVTGTWSGSVIARVSADGGTVYYDASVLSISPPLGTTQTSVTTNGLYFFPISGDTVKISMTGYVSGTCTVRTSSTTSPINPAQNTLLEQVAKVGITDSYAPRLPYTIVDNGTLVTDADNQLITRGDVLTDEGTFRDDFTGVAIDTNKWTATSSGTGASVSVVNSIVSIVSGTANAANARIVAVGDYGPISVRSQFSLSQRVANQTTLFGFADNIVSPSIGAYFQFTGTSNTVVDCISRSSSAAADTQTTTATIPNGTSATSNDYYIEVQPDQVTFFINGFQVANHKLHMPGPYDSLDIGAYIVNSAVVTTTNLAIDYIYFINQNSLQINNSFIGDPIAVKVQTSGVPTYGSAIRGLAAANNATDIFTITGSATKTVRIKHISMDGTRTTAGVISVLLIKRSTANSAGTSTSPTVVPYDSANPTGTAVVRAYTANPTLGTTVGTVHAEKLFVSTTTSQPDELKFDFTALSNSQEIVLRGANEVLAINLGTTTVAGNSFNIDITWTEE